jgi:hypothetical protein
MTALTRTPQTTDLLQPTKFLLTFGKINTVQYFCQSVNLPGMSIGSGAFNTMVENLHVPGNKIKYENLKITFLMDEKLLAWQQLHLWFRSIASPEGFPDRVRLNAMSNKLSVGKPSYYSDASLTVLSALNNPILRIQFNNVFPISLSDVEFDSSKSADDVMTATAEFVFDHFNFLPT